MDSDAEDIWTKRLRKDVDVDSINDVESLLKEIDDTPDSVFLTSKKGIVFERDLTEAKDNLKTFVNDLISGSGSLQDNIIKNNTEELIGATTKEQVDVIVDRVQGITDLDSDSRVSFRNQGALRERELLKEIAPEDITEQQILDSPRRTIKGFAKDFGITEDKAREVVVREDFTLSPNEKTFKK
tara:strand:+ start:123 stop:674 length:552 start_codon:yes stop_codon:yes gene_type:complete